MTGSHDRSLPASTPSREALAQLEIGHTDVSPATARALVAVFLGIITIAPIAEIVAASLAGARDRAPVWSHLAELPSDISTAVTTQSEHADPWSRIVAGNRAVLAALAEFETALEDESAIGRTLRPGAQLVLTGWLGVGNERVYLGKGGWLFYRPDVEYATGPGFLEPSWMERRVAAADEWTTPPQPDPRPAIRKLRRDLEARGIRLIVVPTPVKPTVHPERLAARFEGRSEPPHNASFAAFLADLRRDGVEVLDLSIAFANARAGGPQYLATDTHWRPETMELAAQLLASAIEASSDLPRAAAPSHQVDQREVRHSGDTFQMLDLPATQRLYEAEQVWIRRIVQGDGAAWRPSRTADVLVLGDSFSNIYSLASMGWGDSAGFVEHLGYALGRPVDRLVQNDNGAFATRSLLQAALAREPARFARTKVVVYQFAARELAFGDWQLLSLPETLP